MKIGELVRNLQEFSRFDKRFITLKSISVSADRYQPKLDWNRQIPNADENGIYIYTNLEDEVLYIGKGEFANGGGIGTRSCSHVGARQEGEIMFGNHDWKNDGSVDQSVKDGIAKGEFLMRTIVVEPCTYSSLVEVYLQTVYYMTHSNHPPLNKRFG